MNTRNLRAKYGAKLAVVASSVIAAGQALAQTAPTTGVEAVEAEAQKLKAAKSAADAKAKAEAEAAAEAEAPAEEAQAE